MFVAHQHPDGVGGGPLAVQVAADGSRVTAFGCQRSAVEPAAGHAHLGNAAVRPDLHPLGAALPGIHAAVGGAVIEDVVLPVDAFQPAVVVAEGVAGFLAGKQVTVAHHHAAIAESAVGPVADRVAQLVAGNGRVNKVVFSADLADGAGLKQFVPGKAGAPGMAHGGQQAARFGAQGEHIILQRHDHRGFLRLDRLLFGARSVAGIQVDGAVLVPEHAGVKGDGIPRALPQDATLPVPHHAVEHIVPGGGIAYRHADGLHLVVGAVVEVVAPILALYHVGAHSSCSPWGMRGSWVRW